MLALDVSAYSGLITIAQWQAAKERGYGAAIVQAHGGRNPNPYCEATLRNARLADLITGAYVLIMEGESGAAYADFARLACMGEWEHLRACFVDVEGYGATEDQAWDCCGAIKALGQTYGIYTSAYFWRQIGDPPWSKTPLWFAHYETPPSLIPKYPIGKWFRAVGHQFLNTIQIAGFGADVNLFNDTWIRGA